MGTKAAIGAAAALLLALGWWWLEPGPGLAPDSLERATEQVSAEPTEHAGSTGSATTASAAEGAERQALAGATPPAAFALAPDPAGDPTAPGWWLVGAIRGIGRELDSPISIHAQTRDGATEWASGSAAGDGPYRVDLSALLDRPELVRRELLVSFSHPELEGLYLPLSVDLDALRREPGARRQVRADVDLVPSVGFRGRVVLPDGAPAEDAAVAILRRLDDGRPEREESTSARTDSEGAFALRTSAQGPCYVVAFLDGYRPTSLRTRIPVAGFVELGTLHLERGEASIHGRVALPPSAAGQPARIVAWRRPTGDGPREWPWAGLEYEGGRFVPALQRTATDGRGAFELTGLEEGASYALTVDGVGESSLRVGDTGTIVPAPAEGVLLGQDVGLLTVEVQADGEPRAALVGLEDGLGVHQAWTDPEGRLLVLVDRAEDYLIRAELPGYEHGELASPATERPLDARTTLHLRSRARELAALGLELVLVSGHGLPDPQVLLHREGEERDPYPEAVRLERREGALWVDALEPGTYELRVVPGTMDVGFGAASCYLPATLEVELPPGSSVRQLVPLELGGVVRVTTEGVSGQDLAALAELLDAEGEPVDVRYVTRHGRGNETVIGSRKGRLVIGRENTLHPAIPPGTYELRAELPGHRCEPLRFSLAAGEVRELTLRFAPE